MDHLSQHFRPEERPLVERTVEWAQGVALSHKARLTPFLTPREQVIVRSVAGSTPQVKVSAWGGYDEAERRRMLITPEYLSPQEDEFQLALLGIQLDHSTSVSHRDILGSVLGLGIKREMVGDILISAGQIQVIVAQEMEAYITTHLNKVGKKSVKPSVLDWSQLVPAEDTWEARTITVSSLRLDAIVAPCVRMSRTKATGLIKGGKVQVNWKVEDSPAALLNEGDVLSIKGYGRFKVMEITGHTRKGNLLVQLGYKK